MNYKKDNFTKDKF